MTEEQYDHFIVRIAKNIVRMNEDARVYSQHIDAVAEISRHRAARTGRPRVAQQR